MSLFEKDMATQAVINFKDIKSKRASSVIEDEVKEEVKVVNTTSEEPLSIEEKRKMMEVKLNTAKLYGNKELKQFRIIVEDFISKVDELALFQDVSEIAKQMFIQEILEGFMEPVFKGQKPYEVPENMFKKLRAEMFKTLISKYVDNKGDK